METNKKISAIAFTIVFMVVIIVLGLSSFIKLVNFYVNNVTDYNEWSVELGNKFETDEATSFYKKFQFVNMNGALRNLLGQREMNGVIKLNNGYLAAAHEQIPEDTLQGYASKVVSLDEYLQSQNIKLLYVVTPYTVSKYDSQMPEGVYDYSNDNVDRFMTILNSAGIDTIDFRELMHIDGIDQYEMMYKTDHHWTTKAGFYAYCKLEEYLKNNFNCDVDDRISDIINYTILTYKKWHLGSRGQRTGVYFAGIDDFDLIMPNFETSIQNGNIVGTMQDVAYNLAPLKNRDYTSRYTYDSVLGSSLGNFVNLNSRNDLKVLVVTDSFGQAVNPFLMMGVSEIRSIHNNNSDQLTKDYIASYKPDVVILLYYAETLRMPATYNFQGFD